MKRFYTILVLSSAAVRADSSVLNIQILFAELTHFVKQLSQKLPEPAHTAPSKGDLLGQIQQGTQLRPTGKDVTQNIGPAAPKAPDLLQQIQKGKQLKKTRKDVTEVIETKATPETSSLEAALQKQIKQAHISHTEEKKAPEEESNFEDPELEIGSDIDTIYRSLKKRDFLTSKDIKSGSDDLNKLTQRVEKEIHETSIQNKLKNRINALNKIFNFLQKGIQEFSLTPVTQQSVENYISYLENYTKDFDALKILGLETLPRFIKELLQKQVDLVQENLGDEKSSLRNTVVLLNKLIELRKKLELQPFRLKPGIRVPVAPITTVGMRQASPEDTAALLQKALKQRRRAMED